MVVSELASPLVSVVIPTYNRADLVPRAIHSVLAQSYAPVEVIVVDDASTDGTATVMAGITDPRVTYIRCSANRGVSAAKNIGVRASKGELLAFLDDDDVWLPGKLEKQVLLFGSPEVGLVYCGIEVVDREGKRLGAYRPYKRGLIYEALLFKNYLHTSAVVVRRSCLEAGHLFDEGLIAFEDYDLWLRIAETWSVDYVPDALAHVAGFPREHLTSAQRVIPTYEPFIAKFATYRYGSPWKRRLALAYRYYEFANALAAGGQLAPARQRYLRSLGIWPLNLKCWMSLAVTLGGASLHQRVNRFRAPSAQLLNQLRRQRDLGRSGSPQNRASEEAVKPSLPPRISVVIPTYNRSIHLLATVRSALDQGFRDIEVVIVDDASSDDTYAVAAAIGDSRVRVLRHPVNKGVSEALNTGIRESSGELIAILEHDDIWLPDKLARQVPLFDDPEVGLVYCGVDFVDGEEVTRSRFVPSRRGSIYRDLLFKSHIPTSSAVVVRRECFDRVGSFDITLRGPQDYDMWIRIARYYKVDFAPAPLVRFAAYQHSRLNSPSRLIPMYEQLIRKFATYDYPAPLLRRRVLAYRYYALAAVHGFNGNARGARDAYLRSLAIWPFNVKAWAGLGAVLLGPGFYHRFDRAKTQALKLANRLQAR